MNALAPKSVSRPTILPSVCPLAASFCLAAALGLAGPSFFQEKAASGPVKVTIKDEQPLVAEPLVPVDPMRRINYQSQGMSVLVRSENNQTMHLTHYPSLSIDGQIFHQGAGGKPEFQNRPLPKGKDGKDRDGFSSAFVFADGLKITATYSVEPTKTADKSGKRRRDAVLIHYSVENLGKVPHKVGLRIYMDTYMIDNDGCLFAAPTMPGKILDGVVLRDNQLPAYVQMLQRADLKNPGFVGHLTIDLGSKLEKPDHIVLTHHGAGLGAWDMPAGLANGDSALGIFWQPKEIKPGEKRELAYGFGQGVISSPENEGRVEVALSGSFEPGKLFDVTAYVSDMSPGQFLTLELPDGMTLVEGKHQQPVPELHQGETQSVVFWRARVLRTGQFAVRVRASTGLTQGKVVTIAKSDR